MNTPATPTHTTPATPTYPTPHTTPPAATPPADAGPSLDWDRPARLLVEGRLIRGAYHDVRGDGQDCYCLLSALDTQLATLEGRALYGRTYVLPSWLEAALIRFDDQTSYVDWPENMERLTVSMKTWAVFSRLDWLNVLVATWEAFGLKVGENQDLHSLEYAVRQRNKAWDRPQWDNVLHAFLDQVDAALEACSAQHAAPATTTTQK